MNKSRIKQQTKAIAGLFSALPYVGVIFVFAMIVAAMLGVTVRIIVELFQMTYHAW